MPDSRLNQVPILLSVNMRQTFERHGLTAARTGNHSLIRRNAMSARRVSHAKMRCMGWWVRRPALHRGEAIFWAVGANHEQSTHRQVGGRLFVTNKRLIFQPNRFDVLTKGKQWSVSVTDVVGLEKLPGRLTPPFLARAAQLRDRLVVLDVRGEKAIFVVNHLDGVLEKLHEVMRSATSSETSGLS